MRKSQAVVSTIMFMFLALCLSPFSEANLIGNGDFSNGLAGWSTSGNVSEKDYARLPSQYTRNWDLSTWNSRLAGGFAFIEGRGQLFTSLFNVRDTSSLALSLDYAVAWEGSGSSSTGLDYGYFYCQVDGKAEDNRIYPLAYEEIGWQNKPNRGVLTGSIFTDNFIQRPDLVYTEILLSINAFNPFQLNQIIGIDHVNLSAAPVPEPATLLFLASGLAGFAGLYRKKLKR